MNIDRTHKENILYIQEETNFKVSPSYTSNVSIKDMYDFVKDDLVLAQCNQIQDDICDEIEFDEQDFPIAFNMKPKIETELGPLGQDIILSQNPVIDFILNSNEAFKCNASLECNEYNYTNVLAGALKQAINKIESQDKVIKDLEDKVNTILSKINT